MEKKKEGSQRIPPWIKMQVPGGKAYTKVKRAINSRHLNTVCLQANCPNIGDCLCKGTVTFMIMGKNCTRNCKYCAVSHENPTPLDPLEPIKIAQAIKELNLRYAVITSVTRDDLPDGGASHFASTTQAIRKLTPNCKIELLVPDFKKNQKESFSIIHKSKPNVFNHNIEVVPSLFAQVRELGNYQRSLQLLKLASNVNMVVKSGLMIGLGETREEIDQTMKDLVENGVQLLTIGQYLRSSKENLPVSHYYPEEIFKQLEIRALELGFMQATCSPMARSSWHAEQMATHDNP